MDNIAHQNVHTQAAQMHPLVFAELHRVDIVIRTLRRTIAVFFATQIILENVIQTWDSHASHTGRQEFALMMLMVITGFHQRKEMINWFLKPLQMATLKPYLK
jgi:hypothetical protein